MQAKFPFLSLAGYKGFATRFLGLFAKACLAEPEKGYLSNSHAETLCGLGMGCCLRAFRNDSYFYKLLPLLCEESHPMGYGVQLRI